jgi:hypothetical protein
MVRRHCCQSERDAEEAEAEGSAALAIIVHPRAAIGTEVGARPRGLSGDNRTALD